MSDARILLIWRGWSESYVWRSGLAEFQDVICGIDDVDVVTPVTRSRGNGRLIQAAQWCLRRAGGVTLAFDPRLQPIHIERDYELCCVVAQGIQDLSILEAIPNWRSRSRRAVCWIEELWLTEIARETPLAVLRQFDRVVTPFINTADTLSKMTDVPCDWQPHGVDAVRFCPGAHPPPRRIDFFSMGRRSEATHGAIMEYANQHGWFYFFDGGYGERVAHMRAHRQRLAELIKRSRYFLVNKAKVGETKQASDQEELACRYFEGAAAGAVLVGDVPQSSSFTKCFDWPDAVFRIPYGSTAVGNVFDQLETEPERVSAVRRQNVTQVLRRFDWAYRWQDVLRSVGLAPRNALLARLATLAALVAEVQIAPMA